MAKEEKIEQAAKVVAEQQEAVVKEDAQAQVFTPEQQTQIEALIAEAEKAGYGKAEEELGRKEQVILKLQKGKRAYKEQAPQVGQFGQPAIAPDAVSILLGDMKAREAEEGVRNPAIPKLEAALSMAYQKQAYDTQMARWQGKVTQERERLDEAIEALNLSPDVELDEVYEAFEDAAEQTGKFERVHKRLEKIATKSKPKAEKPTETKGESEEEKERKVLEKHGLLTSETGQPSASSSSWKKAQADYAEGRSGYEAYKKAREAEGII